MTASVARVERITMALSEEFGKPPIEFVNEAEGFLAVLDHYGLAEYELLSWIRIRKPGKEWSLREWRSNCEELDRLRECLGLPVAVADQVESMRLCLRCHSSILNCVNRVWFCAQCGVEVEVPGV